MKGAPRSAFFVMLASRNKPAHSMADAKRFVGQPVYKQIFDCLPADLLRQATNKHRANHYYKKLPVRVHLSALLHGVLIFCNGLRELCEGLLACEGKPGPSGHGQGTEPLHPIRCQQPAQLPILRNTLLRPGSPLSKLYLGQPPKRPFHPQPAHY